ncbi:hypothetical protein CHUAL_009757 [Chamberlinius hualienensis]
MGFDEHKVVKHKSIFVYPLDPDNHTNDKEIYNRHNFFKDINNKWLPAGKCFETFLGHITQVYPGFGLPKMDEVQLGVDEKNFNELIDTPEDIVIEIQPHSEEVSDGEEAEVDLTSPQLQQWIKFGNTCHLISVRCCKVSYQSLRSMADIISKLQRYAQSAFEGFKSLNGIHSRMFPAAMGSAESFSVCLLDFRISRLTGIFKKENGENLSQTAFQQDNLKQFLKNHNLSWLNDINQGHSTEGCKTLKSLGLAERSLLSPKKPFLTLSKWFASASELPHEEIHNHIQELNEEPNVILYQETLPMTVLKFEAEVWYAQKPKCEAYIFNWEPFNLFLFSIFEKEDHNRV